jgi:8-oxo-dGTP pyrophosphatase MutT (NUDIX family)
MMKSKIIALSLLLLASCMPPNIARSRNTPNQNKTGKHQHPRQRRQQPPQLQGVPALSEYLFGAGSVLFVFIDRNGKTYAILTREAHGSAKGTYDDFGGKRDAGEKHPLITAKRECFEEAILDLTIKFTEKDTLAFIDLPGQNTQYIIAHARNVGYITDFSAHADRFFDNFYNALAKTTSSHSREKDKLAVVAWDTLQNTISQTTHDSGITVPALVLDQHTNEWCEELIPLRGFFVKKYRPFFMNQAYQAGKVKKIRFYDQVVASPIVPPAGAIQVASLVKNRPQAIKAGVRGKQSWNRRFWQWFKF